jgi:nitroreductase
MFMEMIRKRRSIRKYEDRPVDPETVDRLVEAGLRSPSSRDLNPWEFVVVTEAADLKKLASAKPHGSSFLANAPLGIVVCADESKSDVWIEDCSIACTFIQLAAESLGLGSCWIQIRLRGHDDGTAAADHIREVLGIPDHLTVAAVVAAGYPDENKDPHAFADLPAAKAHRGRFGEPYDFS